MLRRLAVVACILIIPGLIAGPGARASEIPSVTLEGAVELAYEEGAEAKKAEIELSETLLKAANLEHQHRLGPPGRQSITIRFDVPLPENEEIPEKLPIEFSIPIGGPTDMEEAQVEEILPIQFASLRRTAEAAFEQRMASIRSRVIEQYFGAILAQEELDVRRAGVERLEVQRDQVAAMYDRGVVPELDLVQVEAALSNARYEQFEAEEMRDMAFAALNRSLGQPMDARPTLITTEIPDNPLDASLPEDIEQAREASAEIAALEGQLEVAEQELDIFRRIKGTYSPRRSYRERELEVERKEIELLDTERGIELSAMGLRSQIARARAQVDATAQGLAAAERALEVSQLKYDAGMHTISEVLEADASLMGAELAHRAAGVEVLAKTADRDTLLGRVGPHVEERLEAIRSDIEELR